MNDTGASIERQPVVSEPQGVLRYSPAPPWVACEPAPAVPNQPLEDFTDQGVLRILHETQLSLMEPGFVVHMRVLQRVLTRTGAERAANVAIEFDPAHERLEVGRSRQLRPRAIFVWLPS